GPRIPGHRGAWKPPVEPANQRRLAALVPREKRAESTLHSRRARFRLRHKGARNRGQKFRRSRDRECTAMKKLACATLVVLGAGIASMLLATPLDAKGSGGGH